MNMSLHRKAVPPLSGRNSSFEKTRVVIDQDILSPIDNTTIVSSLSQSDDDVSTPRNIIHPQRRTLKKLTDVFNMNKTQSIIPITPIAKNTSDLEFMNENNILLDIKTLENEFQNKEKDLLQCKMQTFLGDLVRKCLVYNIAFFHDIVRVVYIDIPFNQQDIINCRICVHSMEFTHIQLLHSFIKILQKVQDQNEIIVSTICRLLINDLFQQQLTIDMFIKLGSFLEICKSKEFEIFDLNSIEPYYALENDSFIITQASNNSLIQLVFSRIVQTNQFMEDYIHFTPYISNFKTTFETFLNVLHSIEQNESDCSISKEWIMFSVIRFEKMISHWITVMGNGIKEECPRLFYHISTSLKSSSTLTPKFKKDLDGVIKVFSKFTRRPSKLEPYKSTHVNMLLKELTNTNYIKTNDIHTQQSSQQITSKDKILRYSKMVLSVLNQCKSSLLTQQLILVDQSMFSKINTYDLYLKNDGGSLEQYINGCRKIEEVLIEILCNQNTTKDIIKKCISIAKKCITYHNFNISFILYSVLTRTSVSNSNVWNKLEKKSLNKYSKLQELYSIGRNHYNYRIIYEGSPFPKVPILSIWMHDIVNINEIPTFADDEKYLINVAKIRSLSSMIKSLKSVQQNTYIFNEDSRLLSLLNGVYSL
ncbi:Ras-GEF domain-containing protein [Entamoeba marina]